MKLCFIMGGVPGSGKSSAARAIAQSNWMASENSMQSYHGVFWTEKSVQYFGYVYDGEVQEICAAIHSTDEYFMKDGVYKFNPKQLGIFHNANYKAFRQSLMDEIPIVICDNTNTQRKEWGKYAREAEQQGYIVAHVTLPHPKPQVAAKRNTHGVPVEAIRRMINRWQDNRS